MSDRIRDTRRTDVGDRRGTGTETAREARLVATTRDETTAYAIDSVSTA